MAGSFLLHQIREKRNGTQGILPGQHSAVDERLGKCFSQHQWKRDGQETHFGLAFAKQRWSQASRQVQRLFREVD
jgi:hypothetical protein